MIVAEAAGRDRFATMHRLVFESGFRKTGCEFKGGIT